MLHVWNFKLQLLTSQVKLYLLNTVVYTDLAYWNIGKLSSELCLNIIS